MPHESWQVSKIVAGRAQHADDAPGAGLGNRVGRAAVVPEDLPVRRGEGRDGKSRCAPIRSEKEIHALLGQQPRDVLPSVSRAACLVEGDEAEWAVRSIPTDLQAARAHAVLHPEADPVVSFLPLAAQGSAHR